MLCAAFGGDSVHPRACGEHQDVDYVHIDPAGSSPRVRGTQVPALRLRRHWRFIPARAGNTSSATVYAGTISVHPRACGEHVLDAMHGRIDRGSSPRVRGTPSPVPIRPLPYRFIPARAGNTAC